MSLSQSLLQDLIRYGTVAQEWVSDGPGIVTDLPLTYPCAMDNQQGLVV